MSATPLGFLALVVVGGAAALWFRRVARVDIPKDRRGFVAAWLLGAALGIAAFTEGVGWLGGIPAGLAVVAGLLFSCLVAISRQKVGEGAIQVGERLRPFDAVDQHGHAFSSASLAGAPVLLKFFRGHW